VFVEAVHCFTYAWNASVIDGTDIVRSVAALGREFKFPLDIQLSSEPVPVDGDVGMLHGFLRVHQDHARLANEFLKVITEDRRCYHRERMNQNRVQVLYKVGDVVLVRVQVQSNAQLDRVAKLSYRLRGPMIVKEVLGNGAYSVTRLDNPDGPRRKYHAQDLSLLPPVLWPVEPLDGPDLRYLNSNHAPLPHPLAHPFNIKLYNEMWLSDPVSSSPPQLIVTRPEVHSVADKEWPSVSVDPDSVATPQDNSCISVPIEDSDVVLPEKATDSAILFHKIELSTDRLFFISFRMPGTLRAKWFLVAVDLTQTAAETGRCGDPKVSGTYFVHFYGRHPSDDSDSDCEARWWPLWHEFVIADDGVIDYGKRVLVPPSQSIDKRQLLPWGECVTLLDQSLCLLGPFDFWIPLRIHQDDRFVLGNLCLDMCGFTCRSFVLFMVCGYLVYCLLQLLIPSNVEIGNGK
jgi:hypothetical protein